MTIEWTGPNKDKLEALERLVDFANHLDRQAVRARWGRAAARVRPEHLLEERSIVTRAAVEARSQAMDLDTTAEI
jgi:hypothetical protein